MARISPQIALIIIGLAFYSLSSCTAASTGCSESNKPCIGNDDCCSACCQGGVCTSDCRYSPCDVTLCPSGKHCVLQAVMCIRAPCPSVPSCLPDDYDEDYLNKEN